MRHLLTLLIATTALPAFADTITATSRVSAVTLYPEGAKITRELRVTAPAAGRHELVITDLPAGSDPAMMRLAGGEGFRFGAFSLRSDRLPPRATPESPEQLAAKALLEEAEAATEAAAIALEQIAARTRAAEARISYLSSLAGSASEGAGPAELREIAAMIGAETLAAASEAVQAGADRLPAQRLMEKAQKAEAEARAAYDSLPAADQNYTALVAAFEADAAGEALVRLTHYTDAAGWRPFYDLDLRRSAEGAKISVERSVLVTQASGEDWSGVELTLSSSRPSAQAAPSQLWPELRRVEPDMPVIAGRMALAADSAYEAGAPPVMIEAPAPVAAKAALEGETVVYPYPGAVDLASGVEDLRLSLDQLSFSAEVTALAVPRFDQTAFVMAEFTNSSGEPLLPGMAALYREGVLSGTTHLGMTAAGAMAELSFGALDQIRLSRAMPQRDGGERGVFSTSHELTETAVLKVENFGDETWPLRLLDQVPYSEQQDLAISYTARPAASETDPEGQRGVLAWEFDLAPRESYEISLSYTLNWPEGLVLR